MPNRAAARRPRTAAGDTPPNIARDVAQVSAACRRLPEVLDCCPEVTTQVTVSVASAALRSSLPGSHRDVVLPALAQFAAGHRHPVPYWLVEDLEAAFDAADPVGDIEAVVADAVAAGVDGELLCWDVISRESLKHIGLIRKEASKMVRRLPETSPDELLGYGWAGLRVALRKYDPALGFAFSTYACPRINGAIRSGVREEGPLVKRLTTLARAAHSAEEALTHELRRAPTYSEIAARLDVSAEHAALLPRLSPAASLDELSRPDSDTAREPSWLVSDDDTASEALRRVQIDAVRAAIADLPADEADAIRELCLAERTLADAAAVLGVEVRSLRAAKRRGLATLADRLRDTAAVPA